MKKYSDNQTAEGVKTSTIMADWFDEGVRIIIMRGPAALCAYVGIPKDHPLAGFDYNDLPSIDAHGGLTFSSEGGGKYAKGHKLAGKKTPWPSGYWWYGWDYAHLGDKTDFDYPPKLKKALAKITAKYNDVHKDDHNWTIGEIKKEAWSVVYDLKKLMKLAEKIYAKRGKKIPAKNS